MMFTSFCCMPSATATPHATMPTNASKTDDSWVFVCRMKDMGLVIMRLSPLGVKWESQLADGLGDTKTREVRVFSDQTKKYCVQTSDDLASQVARSSELAKRASESRGWKFENWKKIGTDSVLGFRCNVYERHRLRKGIVNIIDKIWILDDPRLAEYKEVAGDILALASRTRLPEKGLPIRKTAHYVDLTHHATAQPAVTVKLEPGEDPLSILGPPPDQDNRSNHSTAKPVKVNKPPAKSKQLAEMEPDVEFTLISANREKTDPSRFKFPKGYTRVKNFSDVLELGGLDGVLSY